MNLKLKLFSMSLLLAVLTSCGGEPPVVQKFERPVRVYNVESLDYINRSFTGYVTSDQTVNLGFKVGGQIIKLNIEEGDIVKKGQLIAEIDPIDYSLKLDAAKATYINSKSQLDRFSKLVERNAISQQEYEMAQANFARDKAAYENAVIVLKDTKLYAPFEGVVQKRYVENFERVNPSEPVIFLSNPALLNINFTLPESSASIMKDPEKSFSVVFDNYPDQSFKAKLYKFVDVSTDGSGMPVALTLDDPQFLTKNYDIRPGFTCTVNLRLFNPGMVNITAVPITAIYPSLSSENTSVWIVDKNNTVRLQKVTIGQLFGTDMVTVNSGLKPGDSVVTAGVFQLVEGQKVKILN